MVNASTAHCAILSSFLINNREYMTKILHDTATVLLINVSPAWPLLTNVPLNASSYPENFKSSGFFCFVAVPPSILMGDWASLPQLGYFSGHFDVSEILLCEMPFETYAYGHYISHIIFLAHFRFMHNNSYIVNDNLVVYRFPTPRWV